MLTDELKQRITQAVQAAQSFQEAAQLSGQSRTSITRWIKKLGLDISHFRPGRGRFLDTSKVLVDGIKRINSTVKSLVLREDLLSYRCECGQGPTWNGKPLTLQLDHIDGNPKNNMITNLRFLCPNCHSQTSTFTGRNSKGKKKIRKKS